jgi:flagellin-like hook-associated protein FlgL
MITQTGLTQTSYRIAQFYRYNESRRADALLRVASGRKHSSPKTNPVEYFRAQRIRRDSSDYSRIQRDIGEASAKIDVAVNAGEYVFEGLQRLDELVDFYWDDARNESERIFAEAEFDTLAEKLQYTIENTYYGDLQLIQDETPLASIMIDSTDHTQKYDIEFTSSDIADTSALTLSGPDKATVKSDVKAQLDKAASYLAKLSAYSDGLRSQYDLVETKKTREAEYDSSINDANAAMDMMEVVERGIRQQSSLAMLAQTNMYRGGIVQLLQMDYIR